MRERQSEKKNGMDFQDMPAGIRLYPKERGFLCDMSASEWRGEQLSSRWFPAEIRRLWDLFFVNAIERSSFLLMWVSL